MSVFDDKKFEQLDWMTQITETIESELNGLLARLPDRLVIGADTLVNAISSSYANLYTSSVVRDLMNKLPDKPSLTWEETQRLSKCFKFELTDNFEIDLTNLENPVKGEVVLVKITQTLEDKDLQDIMGQKGLKELHELKFTDNAPIERMNEILDIVGGCEDAIKSRSALKKRDALVVRLRSVFKTNEWRIRDMKLADKVGTWIAGYISTGNLASLTNFYKLKVMTHNNMPIYSVEEEK